MNKFFLAVKASSPQLARDLADIYDKGDAAAKRALTEYGAVFVARDGAVPPEKIVFESDAEVVAFQSGLQIKGNAIGGLRVELQAPAMTALENAIAEAKESGLDITPRGADSARRGYDESVELWLSRVHPALEHWVTKHRLSKEEAGRIKALSPYYQVSEVLKLEDQGIYFAKDFTKSIMYSVAPPGASQHLSMLALDVREFEDAKGREILAANGWFQTVVSDLPHFTFLGAAESELESLGLIKVMSGGRSFWIPDLK